MKTIHSSKSGFTLLELMVAMIIFALIMLTANGLLKNSIDTKEAITGRSGALIEIQKTARIFKDDFSQVTTRTIRNEQNQIEPAMVLNQGIYIAAFTRNGWANPLNAKRSSLQRVAYAFKDGKLLRYYWPVLDRVQNIIPQEQVLLENLDSASINLLGSKAMGINLQHKILGQIRIVANIAAYQPSPIKVPEKKPLTPTKPSHEEENKQKAVDEPNQQ